MKTLPFPKHVFLYHCILFNVCQLIYSKWASYLTLCGQGVIMSVWKVRKTWFQAAKRRFIFLKRANNGFSCWWLIVSGFTLAFDRNTCRGICVYYFEQPILFFQFTECIKNDPSTDTMLSIFDFTRAITPFYPYITQMTWLEQIP